MNDWIELGAWVLFALLTWLGVARILEEPPASGERRPRKVMRSRRDAPTGTGPAQGPRLYKDVATDHRDYGDEDAPRYSAGPLVTVTCAQPGCDGQMVRARDGRRCNTCGRLLGAPVRGQPPSYGTILDLERRLIEQGGDTIPVEKPYGLGEKWNPSILQPSAEFTEETIKKAQRRIARPPHVKHKRDGIRLGDEASAELLKGIFGDDAPK